MFEFITYFLDKIGSYSGFILLLKNIIFLYHKPIYFNFYILGAFIDIIINLVLKGLIQQVRPTIDLRLYNASNTYFRRFIMKDGLPYDLYGMPSGHVQSVFYSTTYAMFVFKNKNHLYFDLMICFITFYQRINGNYHTFFQSLIGCMVGILTGYFFYTLATKKLIGNLKQKCDDYAYI